MGISIFPSTAAEFVSNNFVVDMNDTSNNTADTDGVKQAGPYSMSFSSGDTSFDVYLINEDGDSVGYSNNTSIVASGLFTTVVILGVAQDEVISFLYQGSVNNADGEGDEPGAGAYLESISPSDLPTIDDTATVTGGNFGTDTEIKFESGATVLDAKNITVNNSTELIVTRPDNLDAGLDPWTLRAVTTGVPEPTGTNANLLVDEVTAGDSPVWVTTSPLASGTVNVAYTDTLEATDPDGGAVTYSIVSGTLPTGLSLDSSTGVISGTPTAGGQTFTAEATDDGGSQTTREFTISIQLATGGTVSTDDNFTYHTFVTSGDFEPLIDIPSAEYLVVAGGGAGGNNAAGGGGAGGLLNGTANLTAGTIAVAVGAGGVVSGSNDPAADGSNSSFGTIATSVGGGGGSRQQTNGRDGGSGGGGGDEDFAGTTLGGSGTAGQGNDGGDGIARGYPGGGGGAGQTGFDGDGFSFPNSGNGGAGLEFADFASATSTGDGGFYAGGGGAGSDADGTGGAGGGGDNGVSGTNATGGGGGGQGDGGSGIVIVRY